MYHIYTFSRHSLFSVYNYNSNDVANNNNESSNNNEVSVVDNSNIMLENPLFPCANILNLISN